jgi:hypothetical protein
VSLRVLLAIASSGCLGPLVSDTPAPSGQLLPAGSTVPEIETNTDLAAQIRANQFVSGVVPLHSLFGGGGPIAAWDFGPALDHTSPMFELIGTDGMPLQHPEIVDFAPGDRGYSPFWSVWHVQVTASYAGELITSVTALDEALRLGLVEAPVAQAAGVNFPVATNDVRLELPAAPPADSDDRFYYRGYAMTYFELGPVMLAPDKVTVLPLSRYILHREGEEPLDEGIRGVDIDGDGDIRDSNDILAGVTGDQSTTSAYRTVTVAVAKAVSSIDTSQNQAIADLRGEAQLFDPQPVAGVVIGYQSTDELRDYAVVGQRPDD